MKKHVLFLFATLLSLAASAHNFEVDGIYYNFISKTDKTVEVTFKGDSYDSYTNEYSGSITVPATVTYYGVTYSVTSIGENAFRGCSSLTAINIPEKSKLTSIGKYAFEGCSRLTAVRISSLEVWCNIDFANYSANPLSSAKNLYLNRVLVTELTIPNSVTAIKNYVFYGCNLKGITLPESVTSIGEWAFEGCSSLTAVHISSLEVWCNIDFANYSANPLYYAKNLYLNGDLVTELTIPNSVTTIKNYAFYGCSLTAITIPEGVTSIGDWAFYNCSSLTAVHISSLEVWCNIDFANSYANPLSSAKNLYLNGDLVTELTIPNSVTAIKNYAFYGYSKLTAITIPEDSKLTSIGESAFSGCKSLNTVINYSDLPLQKGSNDYGYVAYYADRVINADEVIDGYAFKTIEGVHYLTGYIGDKTELTLPADYKGENYQIGDEAFRSCSSLTTITIPEGVTSIGNRAFSYCRSLTAIILPESVTSIGDEAFAYCSSLTTITIPESVTSIGNHAFDSCLGLNSITIPESVTSIGDYAFYGCSSLTDVHISSLEGWCNIDFASSSANPLSKNLYLNGDLVTELTIPNSVTAIKNYAFSGCSSLTAITIPEGVTSIGDYAFAYCSSLTSITIPENSKLTSIGDGDFRGCSSLTTITIPESVTSIGDDAFSSCSSLTAINIPEGVTSIGYNAFRSCSSLTSITLPEGVMIIASDAFYGCSSLTAITLPKSVWYIFSNAFAKCPELTDVYCYAEMAPTTEANAFNGSNIEYATLHVPASAINSYKSAAPWSGFGKFRTTSIAVERITLSRSSATLTEGETLTLTVMVTPDDAADKSISWSSSSPSVATVDNTGKVTAIAPGTATITATANDGSGVSAQCEVTVTPASYVITFLVDGEVILTNTLTRGSTINLPDVPAKEGYTFSGWSEVPETMPARDVTVSGTFIVNKYLVTFKIGDEVIAANFFEYGAAIVAPKAPAKEGYTFSGWSEVPETMPAKNVTVSGTFIVNKYLVTFKIDDVVFASYSLEYGATITLPSTPPTREGYTFSGWGEVAETVPANDVTYSAYYIANVYMVYYFAGAKLVNMVKVTYGEPIPEYIYEPTTEGDEFLGWIGETYATMPAHDVTYTANISSDINTMSTDKGQQTIVIYDTTGRKVTDTKNLKGGIYIINGRKVMIK